MKLCRKFFCELNKADTANPQVKDKAKKVPFFKKIFPYLKSKFMLPLNYRVKIRNLLPNRYPLTSLLIGFNIYKYIFTNKNKFFIKS